MKKTIITVFTILGILVVVFIGWQLIFNEGGILRTGYNALAGGINEQYEKVAGDGETLLPLWEDTGADTNGQAFDIDTTP